MDLQSRLRLESGAVTSEAAIAIVTLMFVMVTIAQALFVGTKYVQLQALAQHAGQIASASGDPVIRLNQARDFVQEADSSIHASLQPRGAGVDVTLSTDVIHVLVWHPTLSVTTFHVYIDEVAYA